MIIWKTNNIIPKDTIDSLVSDLKKDDRSSAKDFGFYSSYFLPVDERPEEKIKPVYNDIFPKALNELGLLNRSTIAVPFWMKICEKDGGRHGYHMHFTGQEIISWVHFLRPTSKKGFYFIDSDGNQTYPEQNEGDLIMFPSWALHGVDSNTDDDDRVVVAGNIIIHKIESPGLRCFSYNVNNDNITLWETKNVDNIKQEESNK